MVQGVQRALPARDQTDDKQWRVKSQDVEQNMIHSRVQVSRGVRVKPIYEPLICVGMIDERIISHETTFEDGHGSDPKFQPKACPRYCPELHETRL